MAEPSANKNQCASCGHKGKRECPFLKANICTECCGSKRGSVFQCPAECIHFPFGIHNYEQWLRLDGNWLPKALRFILDQIGKDGFEKNLALVSNEGEQTKDEQEAFIYNAVEYSICRGKDEKGQVLADLWEQLGFPGLNNDERVMTRYRRRTFATILEIQKVLNQESVTCLDLLEPDSKPFVVFDRSMSRRAISYTRFISWVCHYPYYSRISGAGLEVNEMVWPHFQEELARMTAEEAEDHPGLTQKQFLIENFGECGDLVRDLNRDLTNNIIRSMDVHQCVAIYKIQGERSEVEAILKNKPDFEWGDQDLQKGDPPGTKYYVWLRVGESKKIEKKMPAAFRHGDDEIQRGILGNVKLCPGRLVVEVLSKQKYTFAKKMVKKYFGKLLTLEKELVVDLVKQMTDETRDWEDEKPLPSKDSIPPEEKARLMQEVMTHHYKKFLDEKIPVLNGMTPREASKNPKMRPQLVNLMKSHLSSMHRMCLEKSFKFDMNWLLDELGLQELR